ncbi:MAG: Ig-like domain-containing protein [Phycisphaerae bacterium]|nr:Ig-like domain-containing protein [Gemmatimonadaceae bacterium]
MNSSNQLDLSMQRPSERAGKVRRAVGLISSIMLLTGLGYACANPNAPPGGPPDAAAPRIVKITPSTGTIGARPKAVVFQFDEVISETPKGVQELAKLVFISPKSGEVDVDWRRGQLDIKPKNGWKPNTVYTVLLGKGIADLRDNAIDTATRIVFSTGGAIPQTKIEGLVFDWLSAQPGDRALIEAIVRDTARKDSTIYQTVSDSIGRYSIEHLPPGNYVVRAILDMNANRSLDRLEGWDSVGVTVTGNSTADLHAFVHDSIGVGIRSVAVLDSNRTLKVTFDKAVSPAQVFSNINFLLRRDEKTDTTTVINITTVFSAPQRALFDSLRAQSTKDSLLRATPADTTLAGRTRRAAEAKQKLQDSLFRVDQQRREDMRQLAVRGGRPLPPKDTTPKPKMKRTPLYTEVYVNLERPLEFGGRYIIRVQNVSSVSGVLNDVTRPRSRALIIVPPKPKAPDDKKAPGDTATATTVPVKR